MDTAAASLGGGTVVRQDGRGFVAFRRAARQLAKELSFGLNDVAFVVLMLHEAAPLFRGSS